MADEIAKWPRAEILQRFRDNEVPSAPLLKRTELLYNDQIIAAEAVTRSTYNGFGEVRQARPAAQFSKTPSELRAPAPKLGEHSGDVLAGLGFSADEIKEMFDCGTVRG